MPICLKVVLRSNDSKFRISRQGWMSRLRNQLKVQFSILQKMTLAYVVFRACSKGYPGSMRFSLVPCHRRGRVYKRKFCLFVCHHAFLLLFLFLLFPLLTKFFPSSNIFLSCPSSPPLTKYFPPFPSSPPLTKYFPSSNIFLFSFVSSIDQIFSFSTYFPPFPSPERGADQTFVSFSFFILLLLRSPNIFHLQIFSSFSFPSMCGITSTLLNNTAYRLQQPL